MRLLYRVKYAVDSTSGRPVVCSPCLHCAAGGECFVSVEAHLDVDVEQAIKMMDGLVAWMKNTNTK